MGCWLKQVEWWEKKENAIGLKMFVGLRIFWAWINVNGLKNDKRKIMKMMGLAQGQMGPKTK